MTGRAVLPVSCLKYANVVSRALTRRSGRSGWSSSPCTAAWWRISAWTSLCPATQPAIELRKVSSAEIQQFSCFLSPSSPALRGVPVYCALLCYAGRAGDDCEHGEPGQLRGACLPLAPGGGSHASARPGVVRQTGSRLQVLQPTVLYCPTVCDVQPGEREHHPAVRHHVGVHPGRVRAFQVLLSATVLTPLQLCFPQFVTDFLASPSGL